MLVLTRKVGEGIWIGDGVRIEVVQIQGNSIRIGIEASKEIRIDRDEVRERKEKPRSEEWGISEP